MNEIAMPRLSDSMEEGTIVSWLVEDGADVSVGETIVEIETDKATMTYESDAAGNLTILVGPNEAVPVGTPIARVGSGRPATGRSIGISPLARRAARRYAIDLSQVAGSGPGGRVMKSDVLAFVAERSPDDESAGAAAVAVAQAAVGPSPATESTPPAGPPTSLHEGGQENAPGAAARSDLTLTVTFAIDRAVEIRERLLRFEGSAPTLADFVLKAVAVALRQNPRLASRRDETAAVPDRIVVASEVVTPEGTCATEMVDADRLSLRTIADRFDRDAAAPGIATSPGPESLVFGIVALEGFEVDGLTTARDPAHAASLTLGGLGGESDAAPAGEGTLGRRVTATLSCDPRRVEIGAAAAFLQSVARLVEEPLRFAC